MLEVNGKRVRGRIYPWGVVEGVFTIVAMVTSLTVTCSGEQRPL